MQTSREIIGMMIKSKREEKAISQQALGDLLDVDRQYIWRLENGKINLTLNYLDKVIEKLNCNQGDFLVLVIID
ncbi:helix-turn-helix transcriptional regulator [Flavobacterium paronense]|uniref:Helix-turn-helix domain-containing protein n=1 Tax=Flavobacterium paronense TaxID=1392775 RepID=A0ABV5GC55_9FLAO|nr:helix-turn-helix transcriptional regulator [Flavobacterium paronense]MDN3677795.1 helix-turn-helix transcriptional regulator [Flavobacterium paronense]